MLTTQYSPQSEQTSGQGSSLSAPLALFASLFLNPPKEYRPAPFAVLNDEYLPNEGEAQLTTLLEGLARAGFGGVYLHPRPGLVTEYLSPRWFELIRHCIRECRRLDLIPHLYDENSYPSGSAGGHVSSRVPDARSRFVIPVRGSGRRHLPDTYLALHAWDHDQPGPDISRRVITDDTEWIAFILQDLAPSPSTGETIFPSLLDRRTSSTFLETTHEAYRKELGELWRDVPSIFTDEPHLPGAGFSAWSPGLHLTHYVLGEFFRSYAYDLREKVAELFYDIGSYTRTRYHFYDLCHHLWVTNWALPLKEWCAKNGIKLTGHYLEHDWPSPYATPGHVHLLAHMDWPGSDMLLGFLLKGHDFYDVQGLDPSPAGAEPHGLLYLRQIHSIANQLNKERVMCEAWGAAGGESAPEDWMRIARWLVVHGVNLIVPHSSWDTIRGSRKADHPPNFAPQSPWFEYIKPLQDELARLSWISNQGECRNRLLIIDSLTTGFCHARKADALEAMAKFDPDEDIFGRVTGDTLRSTSGIKRAADLFVQDLSDHQIDFDLGDEYVLEEFGRVSDGSLIVGERAYSLITLIPGLRNLRTPTITLLEKYLLQGGTLLLQSSHEILVDGRADDLLVRWHKSYPGQILQHDEIDALRDEVVAVYPPRIAFSTSAPTGVAHMCRSLDQGDVIVIVNSSPSEFATLINYPSPRKHLYSLDVACGEIIAVTAQRQADAWILQAVIPSGKAYILFATDEFLPNTPCSTTSSHFRLSTQHTETYLHQATRLSENVLVIDHCRVELGNTLYSSETVTAANRRYWQANGMNPAGWSSSIQYRDQFNARDAMMHSDSGGTARYTFHVSAGVDPGTLQLAAECPESWSIALNGVRIDFAESTSYRDPHIRKISIADGVVIGENIITFEGRPFSVRQEIDQIYILGDFHLAPAAAGFSIIPSKPLGWGSWKDQGLPFYDAEVSYQIAFPPSGGCLSLSRDDFAGALVVVSQSGVEIGRIYEAPWQLDIPASGSRTLEIMVVGLPKNLFGPFHDPRHRWGLATPAMWSGSFVPTDPPPGENYGLVDLGLLRPPRIHETFR